MIAYLYKGEYGLAVFVGDGEECLDKLRVLARSHRFLIWRRGDKYVAMQGEVRETLRRMPFDDVSEGAWNTELSRWLRGGGGGDSRGVCNTCGLRDDCWRSHSGPQGAIPDARSTSARLGWNASAVEELAMTGYEDLWSHCALTEEQTVVDDPTLTAKDLEAVGFQVVTKHRLLDGDAVRSDGWIARAMEKNNLDADSPIADLRKNLPDLDGYVRGGRWGREMRLGNLKLDDDVYQINRVKARVRADKGVKTKAGNKNFAERECSRCVYGCVKTPWRHAEISRCHVSQEEIVFKETAVRADWLYRFAFAARVSDDFPLGVGGRKRKGIVYAPEGDGFQIVSRVYPYKVMGWMSVADTARVVGVELADPKAWLADYRARNPDLDMKLVSWALREMLAAAGKNRSINWYRDGRGKRNDVLAIQLRDKGVISVSTDTSRGCDGTAPRFRFSLVYPYFHSFREQLCRFPGAGRQRW